MSGIECRYCDRDEIQRLQSEVDRLTHAMEEQINACDCQSGIIMVGCHGDTGELEWGACPKCSRFIANLSSPTTEPK